MRKITDIEEIEALPNETKVIVKFDSELVVSGLMINEGQYAPVLLHNCLKRSGNHHVDKRGYKSSWSLRGGICRADIKWVKVQEDNYEVY